MSSARGDRSARITAEAERALSPEAAAAYLAAPMSESERDDALALIRWFRRRYPSGAERLAYVRRAARRWRRDPAT
jgi:hypothetical protein